MAEKKEFLENWEVAIGGIVRPRFRDFVRYSLDQLRLAEPDLWLSTAWMYKKQPASMQTFRVFLLGTATAGERVLGWVGDNTGILGQIVDKFGEQMLEDLDGNITDYFRDQPDTIFLNYTGPKDTELKDIAHRLQKYLKTSVKQFVARLPSLTLFRKDNLIGNPNWELAQTLLIQPEALRSKYLCWYGRLTDQMQERVMRCASAINNTGEFSYFISLETEPEDLMAVYINHTYNSTRFKILTEEELDEVQKLYGQVVREPAVKEARKLRADTEKREAEMVGKYANTTPPYYQGGLLLPIALFVLIVGGGSLWVSLVAVNNPGTQSSYGLPSILTKWIPGVQQMTPVEASPNMWGYTFGFIGAVVVAVLITTRVLNNRRAN